MNSHKIDPFISNKLIFFFLLSTLVLSGCSDLGYYWQAAMGHMDLLNRKQDINQLLNSPKTPPKLKQKLKLVQSVRKFAIQNLALPDGGGYIGYTDINRKYVTMVVTAAPRFELKAHQWCYWFVGCQEYRGYFDEEEARLYGEQMEQQNLDVSVRPVSAYSTLGWLNQPWLPNYFTDPVLNTFLLQNDVDLMATLIHEMAHQIVYVKNNTAFNESFANFVEQEGLRQYLQQSNNIYLSDINGKNLFESYLETQQDQQLFRKILAKTYDRLNILFASSITDAKKQSEKQKLFHDLKNNFQQRKSEFRKLTYDDWFSKPLNNTHLLSVRRYYNQVKTFEDLFQKSGQNWSEFYAMVRLLAKQQM